MSEKLLKPAMEVERGRVQIPRRGWMHKPSSWVHTDSAPWALLRAVLLLQPSSAGGIFSYSSKLSARMVHRNRRVLSSLQSQKHHAIKVTKFLLNGAR